MIYQKRVIPSINAIRSIQKDIAGAADNEDKIKMLLTVLSTADTIRSEIFSPLQREFGLSEGKLIFLLTLKENPQGIPLGALARHVGTTLATVSIMAKRMLASEAPLIELLNDPSDQRTRLARLTPAGGELLKKVLPSHTQRICSFAARLTGDDVRAIETILRKL